MKGLKVESSRIAAAIRGAFSSAAACHCQTDAKLSEEEVLSFLAERRVVHRTDLVPHRAFTISMFRHNHDFSHGVIWNLEHAGITHLSQLKDWVFADLLRVNGIGQTSAVKIERALAEYGILLKDGDPALLEEVMQVADEEGPAESIANGTPEEIAMACSNGLMKLADEMSKSATLLMRAAVKIPQLEKRKTCDINTYLKNEHICGAEVRRIAQPFLNLAAGEKRRPVRRVTTGKRRAASNVEEGRFPAAASS